MIHRLVNRPGAVCLLVLIGAAGCVNVDARPDYARTASLIREQTAQPETYLPGADEAALRAAVTAMLQDGLTADEAVRIALLHNPKLQALFYEVGVSRADVVQAGLPSNPSAGISVQIPSVRAIDGVGLLTKISASVSQNIVDLARADALDVERQRRPPGRQRGVHRPHRESHGPDPAAEKGRPPAQGGSQSEGAARPSARAQTQEEISIVPGTPVNSVSCPRNTHGLVTLAHIGEGQPLLGGPCESPSNLACARPA